MSDTPAPDAQPIPASCALCLFSLETQLPPPQLGRVIVCKRFPPQMIAIPQRQGIQLTAMYPMVSDPCFEFRPKNPPPSVIV